MTTPIRPSLAQLLGTPQAVPNRPQAVDAVSAQRNFFRQAMGEAAPSQASNPQAITPPTFKAADITRATTVPQAAAGNSEQPIQRPGTYLNIRV